MITSVPAMKHPDGILRILNENNFESMEELLEVGEEDMLPELDRLGIKGLDRIRLSNYCKLFFSGTT